MAIFSVAIKGLGAFINTPSGAYAYVPCKLRFPQVIFGLEKSSIIIQLEDFFKPKVIYPNMTKYMPFVYDEKEYITNQKCFIITGNHVAYLTAFFNSSLFKYCFRDSFPELQGGTRELSKIFFDKIPVYEVSDALNLQFHDAIEDIQKEYNKQKAQRIDFMLFDLYGLTAEERKVIGFVEIL